MIAALVTCCRFGGRCARVHQPNCSVARSLASTAAMPLGLCGVADRLLRPGHALRHGCACPRGATIDRRDRTTRGGIAIGSGCLVAAAALAGLSVVSFLLINSFGISAGLSGFQCVALPRLHAAALAAQQLERTGALGLCGSHWAGRGAAGRDWRHSRVAGVAGVMGLPGAFVGLWNEQKQALEYAQTRLAPSDRAADPDLSLDGDLLRDATRRPHRGGALHQTAGDLLGAPV